MTVTCFAQSPARHLHGRVLVVGGGAGGQLDGGDAETPDVRLEVVAADLREGNTTRQIGFSHLNTVNPLIVACIPLKAGLL